MPMGKSIGSSVAQRHSTGSEAELVFFCGSGSGSGEGHIFFTYSKS